MPRTQNPYDSGNVDLSGLEGISKIGDRYRENSKREALGKEVGKALEDGDYKKLTEMSVQYPNLTPVLKNLAGYKSDETRRIQGEGFSSALTTLENLRTQGEDGAYSYPQREDEVFDNMTGEVIGGGEYAPDVQAGMESMDELLQKTDTEISELGGSPSHVREAKKLIAEGNFEQGYNQLRTGFQMGNPKMSLARYGDASTAGKNTSYGAGKRTIRDKGGDGKDYDVTTRRVGGEVENIYTALDGSDSQPEGKVVGVDDNLMTTKERANEKAQDKITQFRVKAHQGRIDDLNSQIYSIANEDRTLAQIEDKIINGDADTGYVEQYLPTWNKDTLELQRLGNTLGLNIIQSTTFGALSAGEMKLAMDTALPKGMQEDDLLEWVQTRRVARKKLRLEMMNYVNFMNDRDPSDPNYKSAQNDWQTMRDEETARENEVTGKPVDVGGFKVIRTR